MWASMGPSGLLSTASASTAAARTLLVAGPSPTSGPCLRRLALTAHISPGSLLCAISPRATRHSHPSSPKRLPSPFHPAQAFPGPEPQNSETQQVGLGEAGRWEPLGPLGSTSKTFHAPVRTHKIKDVLPYAIIYPEQVRKASLALITGREAN